MNYPAKDRSTEKRAARERYLRMCMWFAEMRTPQEVADLVLKYYPEVGTYSRQSAHQFSKRTRWRSIIRYLQRRLLDNIMRVPITHQAIRMLRYETIYKKAMTPQLKSRTPFGDRIYETKLGAAISSLDKAQEELEGKKTTAQQISVNANINIVNQLHTKAEEHKKEIEKDGNGSKPANRVRESLLVVE